MWRTATGSPGDSPTGRAVRRALRASGVRNDKRKITASRSLQAIEEQRVDQRLASRWGGEEAKRNKLSPKGLYAGSRAASRAKSSCFPRRGRLLKTRGRTRALSISACQVCFPRYPTFPQTRALLRPCISEHVSWRTMASVSKPY